MQQTIVLPCLRTSPVHIPRRDLVLSASDSLTLRVTVVESDTPDALLITITGGLGGPAAQLNIWADAPICGCCWDYGRPGTAGGTVLWSGMGTPQIGLGSFDFFLPIGTLANLPQRCGWGVQIGWSDNTSADMLFEGKLHIRGRFGGLAQTSQPLLTDDSIPVHTDTDQQVLA
jgi:hypothetical protein